MLYLILLFFQFLKEKASKQTKLLLKNLNKI